MADASFTQTSFLGGEWSPTMQGRFDRQDYRTALNVCLNSVPVEEGSWTRRSGTRRLGVTRKGKIGTLRELHFSENQPYALEFTPFHIRMWAGTSLVLDGVLGKFVVAGISTASPAVVTTLKPHGMSTGDEVQFEFPQGVSIPTAARLMNHQFEITVIDTTNFSIADPVTGTAINGATISLAGNRVLVGRVLDLSTNYPDSVLQNIRVVQGQDKDGSGVALIMRATQRPIALRVSAQPTGCVPATFNFGPAPFKDGPYQDPIADGSTVTPSAKTGSITLTVTPGGGADLPVFVQFDTVKDPGRLIRLRSEPQDWASGTSYAIGDHVKFADTYWTANVANSGKQPDLDPVNWSIDPGAARWTWGEIQSVSSGTTCVLQLKGSDLLYLTAIKEWRMGLYSEKTAWPTNGTFHEGRLWLGGAQDNRFDGSVSNDFFNFAPTAEDGTVADDNGIAYILNSKDVNPIFWMDPDDNGFVMGTQGGEWYVRASALSDPLSPTSIQAKRVTKYGCSNIEPARSGISLNFVQRDGKNVFEYTTDPSPGKFSGQNISMKAKHLTSVGVASLAYVNLPTPIMWARTSDSKLIGCTYKRDNLYGTEPESFSGWHRHSLADTLTVVNSISAGPSPKGDIDALLLIVEDTATGVYWVETMQPLFTAADTQYTAWLLDHAIRPPAAEVVTVTGVDYVRLWGLDDYVGKTVQVWGAGLDLGDFVVASDGHIDIAIDATGSSFTSAQLAALTVETDQFSGFEATITRADTGSVPIPANLNTITEITPAFPGLSTSGAAINWDAGTVVIQRAGNGANLLGTDGLYFFSIAGGSGSNKTVAQIYGSSGGGEQFVQGPMAYDAHGVSLIWSSTSSNGGVLTKYNPATATSATLGSASSSLTNTSGHIMKPLTIASLTVGAVSYMVMPSLVGSPGISSGCSVAVVNSDAMSFFNAYQLTEQYATVSNGPSLIFDCYSSGTCFLMAGDKLSVHLTGSAAPLKLYNFTMDQWGNATPTGAMTAIGTINPSAVDPTWTHWSDHNTLIYDASDGNVIYHANIQAPAAWAGGSTYAAADLVLGSDNHVYKSTVGSNIGNNPVGDLGVHWTDLGAASYTHSAYVFKVSTRDASVLWAVPVGSIPPGETDTNQTRLLNGRYGYIDGGGTATLYDIHTADGSVTSTTSLTGLGSVSSVMYDDVTGKYVIYAGGHSNGLFTGTNFANAWAALGAAGGLTHHNYVAPFVVGYTYTSDGQIVRPVHPAEAGAQNGPALGKTRRAHMMTAVLNKTQGIKFGTTFTTMHAASLTTPGGTPMTTGLQLYSGTYWNTLEDDYTFDSMLCWRITRPYPATVLATGSFLHTQDR